MGEETIGVDGSDNPQTHLRWAASGSFTCRTMYPKLVVKNAPGTSLFIAQILEVGALMG